MIVSAKLYLYCTRASPAYNIEVDVHETEDDWNEHTITWNNAPPVGAFVAANMVDGKCRFYSWNITSYVQSEYSGDKILSLVVKFPIDDPEHPELNPEYHRDFASKEIWKSYRRPYLEICYAEPTFSVSIIPTSVVMNVGQSQTFMSNVSGGTPPYSYQWYLNNSAVPDATDQNWTFTPTFPGLYEVYLNVTDNVGITAQSNIASVTVNPALMVSISPTTVAMDVGQSVTFQSTVSGGTSPYAYQWYLNDTAVSGATSSDWTFTPTFTGFYLIYVNVMDDVGVTAKSNVASVTVNPELSVSISPISAAINLGDSKTFTSSVSGGTQPYSYQWYLNNSPIPGANASTWIFTSTATGSYALYLNVTDSVNVTAKSNTASITVNPPLEVSISPTSVTMDVDQSVTFTSSVSGGTPPYSYQWYLDDAPVPSATDSTWTFTPTTPGTYEVYLVVADSSDPAESNHVIVIVNPPLAVSINPLSVVMDVGQSQTFTSFVSGGTLPYTYQWYLNVTPTGTDPTWTFAPISPGSYEVYLNVTDDVGVTVKSDVALVTVNPALSVSISPVSITMNVGESQLFTSTVSGGTSPYTYQWYLNDTAVPGATAMNWTFTPTSPGLYEIYVKVTDSVGVTAKSNISSVTVNPVLTVSISPTSVVMDVGQSQLFTSTVLGGTPPYSYQWYLDDTLVSGAIDPTWVFTPTTPGSYMVYLNVTDSIGATAKSNIASVTVNPQLSVSIIPTSVTMDVGQSQLFTSTVSGGTPPYTYQWYLNGTPVSGATSSSWTFTPTLAGFYLIYLRVTDDVSVSAASNTASVTVRGRPKAVFTYSPLYPYVNETVTFNASASTPNGGVISNCTWNFGDGNITTVTYPIITHVFDEAGDYNVTLTVMDSEGFSDSTSLIITVYLPLLYSMNHTAYYLGEEFLISVVVVNATNLYSFEFKLGYNTTLLDAINVTEGYFLKSFGSTSVTTEIHDSEGYIWIKVTLLAPAPPAEGSGVLATIRFKVTYATVYPETVGCTLDLYDTKLNDPLGQPIPHTVHDGWYEFVPPPCEGPGIDVYTQKSDPYSGKGPHQPSDAFGPQAEVVLYAEVHYNCEPVENKMVAFEVWKPGGSKVLSRSASTDSDGIASISFRLPWPGQNAEEEIFGIWNVTASVDIAEITVNDTVTFRVGWIVEILGVETVDNIGQPKGSFVKGEHIYFNLTLQNIAFTSKTATLTIVVYDECGVSIGLVTLQDWVIGSGRSERFIIDLLIPPWSFIGVGRVYANAYTKLPEIGGVPYCPEKPATFMIIKA